MNQPDVEASTDQQQRSPLGEEMEGADALLARITRVASDLVQHIQETPSLRAEVIQILRRFEQAITPPAPPAPDAPFAESTPDPARNEGTATQEPAPVQETVQAPSTEAAQVAVDDSILQDLQAGLAIGNAFTGNEATGRVVRPTIGLDGIARSCRVKAEACLWAVERKKLIAAGVDFHSEVQPRDKTLLEKARALDDCFLWMTTASAPMPEPLELYVELAERYEDAADATDLLAELIQQNDGWEMLEAAMALGAEAQSALREAVLATGCRDEDQCQLGLFHWLRKNTQEREVYIPRFLRMADKPSRAEVSSLNGRIANLQELHRSRASAKKSTTNGLKKIRYHLNQISPGRDNAYYWNKIFSTIDELVPKQMLANDVQLRELLVKYIDEIPEKTVVSRAGQDVLEAIDLFLANRPGADAAEQTLSVRSAEMTAIANNLKGKTLVVIGGEARPYAKEALREAFGLDHVAWITTREHGSAEVFAPYIRASGVGLVLLAIRWSSHCFGVVRDYCREANVPFVRLPAGYNPSQVTHQIVEQVPALANESGQS